MLKSLMTVTSKIGTRGQLTLPKEVRKRFALEPGQDVAFVIRDERLTLIPLTQTLFDLQGVLEPSNLSDEEMREVTRSAQAKRIAEGG